MLAVNGLTTMLPFITVMGFAFALIIIWSKNQ